MKKCSLCKVEKPLAAFHKKMAAKLGVNSSCKECRNAAIRTSYAADPRRFIDGNLKSRYGISLQQYENLLVEQKYSCAICKILVADDDKFRLAVDHDHTCCNTKAKSCGKCIRGLLCMSCNHGLGSFKDNIQVLLKAVTYLEKHS